MGHKPNHTQNLHSNYSHCKRETSHKLQCMNMCTNLHSINAISVCFLNCLYNLLVSFKQFILLLLQNDFDGFNWVKFDNYLHTFIKFFKNNYKLLENNKHNMSLRFTGWSC